MFDWLFFKVSFCQDFLYCYTNNWFIHHFFLSSCHSYTPLHYTTIFSYILNSIQCNTLVAIPYAFKGFPEPNLFRFVFGLALIAANVSMMFVNIGKPPIVLVHLDRIKFPAIPNFSATGESFYTYKGKWDSFIIRLCSC